MSTNPVSFRYAAESQIADMPAHHQQVIRTMLNAITDLQGAIPSLKTQIDAKANATTSSTGSTSSTSSSSSTTSSGVTAAQATVIALSTLQTNLGGVDPQTGTSYTVQPSDYGGIITLSNASPVAVTLGGNGINAQFWSGIENLGAGLATLTPASGTINGAANITLATNQGAILYFDGVNWSAILCAAAGSSGVTQIIAGTNITISPVGGTGAVTVNSSGGTTYLKGSVVVTSSNGNLSGTFTGTGTVTGATISMAAIASAPGLVGLCTTHPVNWAADVLSSNTVEVQVTLPNIGVTWGNITFDVVVFP